MRRVVSSPPKTPNEGSCRLCAHAALPCHDLPEAALPLQASRCRPLLLHSAKARRICLSLSRLGQHPFLNSRAAPRLSPLLTALSLSPKPNQARKHRFIHDPPLFPSRQPLRHLNSSTTVQSKPPIRSHVFPISPLPTSPELLSRGALEPAQSAKSSPPGRSTPFQIVATPPETSGDVFLISAAAVLLVAGHLRCISAPSMAEDVEEPEGPFEQQEDHHYVPDQDGEYEQDQYACHEDEGQDFADDQGEA